MNRHTGGGVAAFLDALGQNLHREGWRADALCAQTDPDAFFPEKGDSAAEAQAVCRRCPVRAECLEWALEKGERFGIYGGLTERERRRLSGRTRSPAAVRRQRVAELSAQGVTPAGIARQLGVPVWQVWHDRSELGASGGAA